MGARSTWFTLTPPTRSTNTDRTTTCLPAPYATTFTTPGRRCRCTSRYPARPLPLTILPTHGARGVLFVALVDPNEEFARIVQLRRPYPPYDAGQDGWRRRTPPRNAPYARLHALPRGKATQGRVATNEFLFEVIREKRQDKSERKALFERIARVELSRHLENSHVSTERWNEEGATVEKRSGVGGWEHRGGGGTLSRVNAHHRWGTSGAGGDPPIRNGPLGSSDPANDGNPGGSGQRGDLAGRVRGRSAAPTSTKNREVSTRLSGGE